ncbi:MAG TPA: cupredoxin domain-containing protein [Solirubrobacterales bacterium]|nr:cupredoxin domain-containing protein [Solirubrobacterales bacterium]
MSRQGLSLATVLGALAIAAIAPAVAPGATHDVDARPSSWQPNQLAIAFGDEIRWHFPSDAGFPHDVWLLAPDDAPDTAGFEVTSGPVSPGGDPVSYTFEQSGTWTFVCKVHSFVSGGAWTGMTGTVNVGGPPTSLRLTVKPKRAKATVGKVKAITARLANTGGTTAQATRVCARAPKKLVKIKGTRCAAFGALAPGAQRQAKFKFKPKPKARGRKVKITFTATAANAPTRTAKATLKVVR